MKRLPGFLQGVQCIIGSKENGVDFPVADSRRVGVRLPGRCDAWRV